MEKPPNHKQTFLRLLAGYSEDDDASAGMTAADLELMEHLTAAAELENLRSSGLPFTLH